MAVVRDRPYANSNFLVYFGGGDPRAPTAGFAEVIFPSFSVEPTGRPRVGSIESQGDPSTEVAVAKHLVLRRGLTGAVDLYAWWNKARRGKAPQRRTVKIELLGDDRSTVVLTWRFRNVRPVSLNYSPLRAAEGGIVMETLELAFESVEMT